MVFLIVFPLLAAALMLVCRSDAARAAVTVASALALMAAAVLLAVWQLPGPARYFSVAPDTAWPGVLGYALGAVEIVCCLYVIVRGVRSKRMFSVFLAGIQACLVVILELLVAHEASVANDLYVDQLSVIMALIIALVGGGICIYALGYMRDFQHHEDAAGKPDRRPVFVSLMFLVLSAMFLIVFSNNLTWLLCGWEVTTVCSFALIGYTRTKEAVDNSFRQIAMNLGGGIAFSVALIILGGGIEVIGGYPAVRILELDVLIEAGAYGIAAFPIMLIAFAGFTKAAQMPFQSWLLGAMVAPTPTSALLHSSTMVKAGVFIIIKLSPTFGWNINGTMVVLIGGLTFLFCSAVAISQSNAKRVLAYSTVANLGLIVACAGIGTPEAVWAAVFLLIFHAAAKSLLFCCVGTAEHHVGSRDIEDMDALFERMPRLAMLMALGMLCMFIAPFGMLISKWAVLVSIVQSHNVMLMLILAFGSALTFMFWAKWLGKILAIAHAEKNLEHDVHASEWSALTGMAVLVIALCVGFPFISQAVVTPYLSEVGESLLLGWLSSWTQISAAIDFDNLLIMGVIVAALVIAFAIQLTRRRRTDLSVYLSGVGLDFESRSFKNSLSGETRSTQRNWYLESWFGEAMVIPAASIVCILVLAAGFVLAYLGIGGLI
jgi:ech hydrogenase subunit A